VSLAERDLLAKEGKIQAEAPPVRKERRIDPETGDEMTVVEGIDPLWGYNIGKSPWGGFTPTDKIANMLITEIGPKAAEKWIAPFIQNTGFREFTKVPVDAGVGYGIPLAVLPEVREFRLSPALQECAEVVGRLLEVIQGNSPLLLLKPSVADKQIHSRKGQEFPWTEYQKLQAIVAKAEYFEIYDKGKTIRLVGFAEHSGRGYPFAWDFEKETRHSVLVTFFHRGSNPQRWQSWKDRKKKEVWSRYMKE